MKAVKAQKLICDLPQEAYRRDRDLFNIRLYENNPVISLYSFAGQYYGSANTLALPPAEQSINNKAASAIDTFASQVGSTQQASRFKVVDGSYRQRRRARELKSFAAGLRKEIRLDQLKRRALLDASILESGVGAIQFYAKDGRCCAERVLATEMAVDPMDGLIDGMPRKLYRRRPIPRAIVMAKFGDTEAKQKAISEAAAVSTGGAPADHIEVFECWSLKSGPKTNDGWHIVALERTGGDLVVEKYEKPRHAIQMLSIEERMTTSWGKSLMTQARGLQLRINLNSYRRDRAQKLFHAGHLYINRAAKINKSTLSNEIGTVWEGNGDTPPQMVQFLGISKEMTDQIKEDGQTIFENLGINIGAAHGTTALGANAPAEALREEKTKGDQRNSVRQQRWEEYDIDCMRAALDVVRDIVGDGKSSYKVAAPGKRGLSQSDWKEAALDEKDYIIEIDTASPVPTDPEGLIAHGERMIELGVWTPQVLEGYLQDLDSDGRTNRQLSQQRNLEKTFEALLYDKSASATPDEYTNYQMAIQLGTEYLAQGEEDEVPEKHLDRVRRYIKRCKTFDAQAKASAAPPPAPPGQGGQPPGPASGPPLGAAPPPQ
jgi:hypothetical protein